MKKNILLLVGLLVLAGCITTSQSEEEKAETAFQQYLAAKQANKPAEEQEKLLDSAFQYLLNSNDEDAEKTLSAFEELIKKNQIPSEQAAALIADRKQKVCANHMQMIGISLIGYTARSYGPFPDDLKGLGKKELDFIKKYMHCPCAKKHHPECDFTYTGKGRRDDNKVDILLICQHHDGWIYALDSDLQIKRIKIIPGKPVFEGKMDYVNKYIKKKK